MIETGPFVDAAIAGQPRLRVTPMDPAYAQALDDFHEHLSAETSRSR